MEKYKVSIKRSAVKEIESIPQLKIRRQIIRLIGKLADDPRPAGAIKLSGQNKYRIRHGVYRIVYGISDKELIITVVKIGHRKDIYRTIG